MSTDPTPIGGEDFKTEWTDMLAHLKDLLDHHKAFEAIQYISTSFFNLLGNFTENVRMGSLAKTEKALSQLQKWRNQIEADFDSEQSAANPNIPANDALALVAKIKNLLNGKDPNFPGVKFPPSFVTSVMKQLTTATTPPITVNPATGKQWTLGEWWKAMWNSSSTADSTALNKPTLLGKRKRSELSPELNGVKRPRLTTALKDDPPPPPPPPPSNPAIQIVTNALTAVSSDLSSQSSIVESKLKYYEAEDEKDKSIMHSMMSGVINQEKQPNNAMQSAGS